MGIISKIPKNRAILYYKDLKEDGTDTGIVFDETYDLTKYILRNNKEGIKNSEIKDLFKSFIDNFNKTRRGHEKERKLVKIKREYLVKYKTKTVVKLYNIN